MDKTQHYKTLIANLIKDKITDDKQEPVHKEQAKLCAAREICTFKKFDTNEEFTGTCYSFRKKYNINQGNLYGIISGKHKSIKGWVLVNRSGIYEEYHNGPDTQYTFVHTLTLEKFEGMMWQFREKYNLSRDGVSSLVNNKIKKYKGWKLINTLSHKGDTNTERSLSINVRCFEKENTNELQQNEV